MVVLDSRPFDEFQRVSIPTATNVPGAELVLRIRDIAPSPDTLVVVNCAGRTRSIIGAQSLINAGLPNKVVALRNGTMGWSLAGLTPRQRQDQALAPTLHRRAWPGPRRRPSASRKRFGVMRIDARGAGELPRRRDAHALSVRRARSGRICRRPFPRRGLRARRPARAGDRPIRRHARRPHRAGRRPRGARRDDGVVAQADGLARRVRAGRDRQRDRPAGRAGARSSAAAGARASRRASCPTLVAKNRATVVDLSLSPAYRKGHIPGAWFAIRARLVAGAGEDSGERRTGADLGGRRARRPRGAAKRRRAGALSRAAATPPGRPPASALAPTPAWPTSRSTTGPSPTSAPATPRAR